MTFFFQNRALNSATDGVARYFISTIDPNSYAAPGIRTHVSTVELHQTGTFRTLYRLRYTVSLELVTNIKIVAALNPCRLGATNWRA